MPLGPQRKNLCVNDSPKGFNSAGRSGDAEMTPVPPERSSTLEGAALHISQDLCRRRLLSKILLKAPVVKMKSPSGATKEAILT